MTIQICKIILHKKEGIVYFYNLKNGQYFYKTTPNLLKKSVSFFKLARKFAHCLDRATDVPGELGQPLKALNSIAPSDRSKVKMDDVSTFVTAESSGKTQLWRESYADLFAVGFMSLDPKYDTAALRESLIKLREKRKEQDPTHNSVCWLQYSKSQPFPQKGSDVYSWANNIRIKAPCELK